MIFRLYTCLYNVQKYYLKTFTMQQEISKPMKYVGDGVLSLILLEVSS